LYESGKEYIQLNIPITAAHKSFDAAAYTFLSVFSQPECLHSEPERDFMSQLSVRSVPLKLFLSLTSLYLRLLMHNENEIVNGLQKIK
jgi:hypothetical protein